MENAVSTEEIPFYQQCMTVVRPIKNWKEWLRLMRTAETLQQKIGLLHVAFEVGLGHREMDPVTFRYEQYTDTDRLQTLFEIADGWADHQLLKTEGGLPADGLRYEFGSDGYGNRTVIRECELRQMIARKAFDMLAVNFFKKLPIDHNNDVRESRSLQQLVSDPLFPFLQNFFRVDKGAREEARIRNLSYYTRNGRERSAHERHAINFLLTLARFLWTWEKPIVSRWEEEPEEVRTRHDKEEYEAVAMQTIVDGAKLWMIEVLSQLGKLQLLDEWVLALNDACLDVLREIALRKVLRTHRHPVSQDRKVTTVDEACYLGSAAGWIIKKHELVVREHRRLNAIRDLEAAREAATQELEALTQRLETQR